jgi:DNA replicative helicase MCM subunit Mcm2 (Cdc46/Mcm family)
VCFALRTTLAFLIEQETPDEIPEGETPNSVTLFAFDDLTDAVRPGDRIEVRTVVHDLMRIPLDLMNPP